MSAVKIIFEVLIILAGLTMVINTIIFELEAYVMLIGLGLIIWGGYDLYKETRDISKKSEVSDMSKEREEIRKKLEEEEEV